MRVVLVELAACSGWTGIWHVHITHACIHPLVQKGSEGSERRGMVCHI